VPNKKNALVILYKLWSAFTKNIRYIIGTKAKSVSLNDLGTFARRSFDSSQVLFIPSSDLVKSLFFDKTNDVSQQECQGPEWSKIATAA